MQSALAPPAERKTWGFDVGEEIVDGLHAWQLLGDGRRFETWLAWSRRLWSHVTVKLPHPDCIDRQTCRALAHEAATVGGLAHPSIQRLLKARPRATTPYLVYEYVEGPPLDGLLAEQGPLASADVARLGMQLAAALHYLHGEGIVHLDLKPSNIVIREGRAVVLDFDIARGVGARGSGRRPRGSPPFMAPEQIRCEPASPAMDLFALGAILYQVATDTPAFEPTGDGLDRVYPQLAGPPVELRTLLPDFPPRLEAAIVQLLEPEPTRRPPSAAAVLSLLAATLARDEEGLWPEWASGLLPTAPAAPKPAVVTALPRR